MERDRVPPHLPRELLRLAAGVALYLALLAPFRALELDRLYGAAVLAVGQAVFLPFQHFPVLERLDNLTLNNLELLVVLTLALFAVSTPIDLATRCRRFGHVLAAIFAMHVVTAYLAIVVRAASEMSAQGILVLLPAEFRIVDGLKYFLYDMGQEAGPFVMLMLALAWNVGVLREPGPVRLRRPTMAAACGVIVALAFVGIAYTRARERDPRHVDAHAKIGHLFWNRGSDAEAERQYRAAVAGGTADLQVFYNLGGLELRHGRRADAEALLRRGLERAGEPVWRARFEKALGLVQTGRASRDL